MLKTILRPIWHFLKINNIWAVYFCFQKYAKNLLGSTGKSSCCKLKQPYLYRSSRPVPFLGKSVLKKCSKYTGKHPCRSAISIKLQNKFIEITFRHGCSLVNSLHISRAPFSKNTSRWLLLFVVINKIPIFTGLLSFKLKFSKKLNFLRICNPQK